MQLSRTTDNDALTARVKETMAETFGADESDLPDDVSQQSYSSWTSLAQLTLLVALEEQFGVSFSITEMNSMSSLPQIVEVLSKRGIQAGT
jgi:acyl carrier protein